jgi:tripartite-type tricarboxylate transporter receptor subunit TctC
MFPKAPFLFRTIALLGLCASGTVEAAFGQDGYHTIKLIVPFAAGGNGDAVGRLTAYYMHKVLDVGVVVENRPGAGGITGTDAAAKSPPDGYTLCVCSTGPITVAPWTEKLPYDALKDLVAVSMINTNPLVLIVNPKVEAKSAAELVALSKTTPGGLAYSSVGAGGLVTFSAEIFRVETGANLVAVPYRGGALATAAVVSGEVQLPPSAVRFAIALKSPNYGQDTTGGYLKLQGSRGAIGPLPNRNESPARTTSTFRRPPCKLVGLLPKS